MENNMLTEMLASLKEVKLQLQTQLAQRPEYRALLVLDKAAWQLAEVLGPLNSPVAMPPESGAAPEPSPTILAAEPTYADLRVADAPAEMPAAVDENAGAPSSPGRCEDRVEDAPVPGALAEEPVKAAPHAVDLFLSSSAQAAAPAAAAPKPRGYLPFVAAPRLVKSGRY